MLRILALGALLAMFVLGALASGGRFAFDLSAWGIALAVAYLLVAGHASLQVWLHEDPQAVLRGHPGADISAGVAIIGPESLLPSGGGHGGGHGGGAGEAERVGTLAGLASPGSKGHRTRALLVAAGPYVPGGSARTRASLRAPVATHFSSSGV